MANNDFIDCTNNNITKEQLMAALVAKDADDNWSLRVMFVEPSEDAIDCDNNGITLDQITNKVVGIDSDGKPAIRLGNSRMAEIESLVTYANDAAAASGGVPVGGWYYKTDVGLHTRMS